VNFTACAQRVLADDTVTGHAAYLGVLCLAVSRRARVARKARRVAESIYTRSARRALAEQPDRVVLSAFYLGRKPTSHEEAVAALARLLYGRATPPRATR
jgi:hypothetical protein